MNILKKKCEYCGKKVEKGIEDIDYLTNKNILGSKELKQLQEAE